MDVYDHVEIGELVTPIERVSAQLLRDVAKPEASA